MAVGAASRLPPLPHLRDFINMYQLSAKKVLSQNYLMDMNVTRKIVRAAGDMTDCHVVEIGPGPGSITRAILEKPCLRVDAVEIDRRFIPPLNYLVEASEGRLHVHHGDALKTDLGELWRVSAEKGDGPLQYEWDDPTEPPMHVIGNLPFNIASPLIIKYLHAMSDRTEAWSFGRVPLTLTFQLEVAKRIVAGIDCNERSRLSIMVQHVAEPKLLFTIPGASFVPRPEVDVGVVRFAPRIRPLVKIHFKTLEKFVRQVFHLRNKFMIKGLKTLYPEDLQEELTNEVLSRARVSHMIRADGIGIEQFGDMAKVYEEQCFRIPGLFLYDHRKPNETLEVLRKEKKTERLFPKSYKFAHEEIPREGVSLRQTLNIQSQVS